MSRYINEIIDDKFQINIGITYSDIVSFTNKDILYDEIGKVVEFIKNNRDFRINFFDYILKNKEILKVIVWNSICKKAKTKNTDIIDAYLEVFYTRVFEYCSDIDVFEAALHMTPDIDVVLNRFLRIIFISNKDIDKLYNDLLMDLIEEEEFFTDEEFEEILKEEFFTNILKL